MTVHDFDQSLRYSHDYQDAYFWEVVYKEAFPNLVGMQDVRQNGWAQLAGIDRRLHLADGSTVHVDEKVRSKDYGDVLLEVWSDYENRKPGWIQKPMAIDYLAYAIPSVALVYLLPFRLLQAAYAKNAEEWRARCAAGKRGYRVVDAKNARYTTRNLALPTQDLLDAMRDSLVIEWGGPNDTARITRIGDHLP